MCTGSARWEGSSRKEAEGGREREGGRPWRKGIVPSSRLCGAGSQNATPQRARWAVGCMGQAANGLGPRLGIAGHMSVVIWKEGSIVWEIKSERPEETGPTGWSCTVGVRARANRRGSAQLAHLRTGDAESRQEQAPRCTVRSPAAFSSARACGQCLRAGPDMSTTRNSSRGWGVARRGTGQVRRAGCVTGMAVTDRTSRTRKLRQARTR